MSPMTASVLLPGPQMIGLTTEINTNTAFTYQYIYLVWFPFRNSLTDRVCLGVLNLKVPVLYYVTIVPAEG